jgi:small-conductance mechanosensitive channel
MLKYTWLRRNLLTPHLLAITAFVLAYMVIEVLGTNRSLPDLILGLIGYVMTLLAIIASIAALVFHPWRRGGAKEWLRLGLHLPALIACFALAFLWLALHLA